LPVPAEAVTQTLAEGSDACRCTALGSGIFFTIGFFLGAAIT